MTIFNGTQFNAGVIAGNIQQRLIALRAAFDGIADMYGWTSTVAVADLVAAGFTAADANMLLSAANDAYAEYLIRVTGLPPSTYPQPSAAYVYSASQRQVIGPQ